MTIPDFIQSTDLEDSLLLGYYGGGNYGDELLLEVLQNLLDRRGIRRAQIAFQQPNNFAALHHDFGYRPFELRHKPELLRATVSSKNIVVGGGGLWGVDMNLNTLLMSIYLWACRWLLGKNVYLLGVGYYSSTTQLGHVGAWFTAHAARGIFARDEESYQNFLRLAPHKTVCDQDLAWYISDLPLDRYEEPARKLGLALKITRPTVVLTTRRPQATKQRTAFAKYNHSVARYIADNPGPHTVIAPLELSRGAEVQPQGELLSPKTNPLTIYALFKQHHDRLVLIGPQFHIMLTAHLTGVPFLPICYDNKVRELFERIGIERSSQLTVEDVTVANIQAFVEHQMKGKN